MVVRSLDENNESFRLKEDNEEVLEPEVPFLSVV